jgi:hypothetical protein
MPKTLYQNTSFPHLQANSSQNRNKIQNEQEGYTIEWQDKQPPRRLWRASFQPATANGPAVGNKEGRATAEVSGHEHIADTKPGTSGPTRHGSETRQTTQVTGRVAYHIKSKLLEKADAQGWTESKAVGEACTVYVENDLAEKFSAKLASRVSDAIDTGLAKHSDREANLAVHAYYAAEESRILNAKVLAYLFGDDTQLYKQTVEHARREARANIKRAIE